MGVSELSSEFLIRLVVGNLSYLLLVVSMMMSRMIPLRIVALGAGVAGGCYSFFWLNDPVGTFWEIIFFLANAGQLLRILYRNQSAHLTDDEIAFQRHIVPSLAAHQVRRLVNAGLWLNAAAGTELIRQGEIVQHLIFIRSGKVDVMFNGSVVGISQGGTLVGEISIRIGDAAIATVRASEPVRYLALKRERLEKVLSADPEIANALESGYWRNLQGKLAQMNVTATPTADSKNPVLALQP